MQEGELKTKRTVVCCSFCQFATKKKENYSMPFFSHSLATILWFGGVIAEHSITK